MILHFLEKSIFKKNWAKMINIGKKKKILDNIMQLNIELFINFKI